MTESLLSEEHAGVLGSRLVTSVFVQRHREGIGTVCAASDVVCLPPSACEGSCAHCAHLLPTAAFRTF